MSFRLARIGIRTAPGERSYHPGYYAAFAIDPAGNNVEVVYHGSAKRSADAIEVTFES